VACVTGGASGIGEALVRAFAEQGTRVAFLDFQVALAEALVASFASKDLPAPVFYRCDLTDIGALQETVRAVLRDHGAIDILVKNAGNDTRHTIEEVTPESWETLIAINLKQQFFMAQAVIPAMRERQRGLDYQHELDCLDDSFGGLACVCRG
jgi:D-xylose 1-dehydrogenase